MRTRSRSTGKKGESEMNRQQSGFTVGQFIIAIVVVVVIAGVAFYFGSDVFRTKVDAHINQLAHWTPENIAKDPENYLNFCEKQTNDALQALKANEVSVAQSRARLQTMKEESEKKVQVGTTALGELKELYTKAEAAKSWPASWRGDNRDKDWVRKQIVSFAKQVDSQKNLAGKVDGGLKNLDAQVSRIQDTRAKAQEQLAEIKTSREMLKVQKITDELTNRLVGMKSVLQATISGATETKGVISLDQLAAEATPTVSDAEFDKIMGGSSTTKP
jgi:hypothetical protein